MLVSCFNQPFSSDHFAAHVLGLSGDSLLLGDALRADGNGPHDR